MTIRLLSVGKRHEASIVAAIDDYTSRLQQYGKPEWVLLPPVHSSNKEQQVAYESTSLLAKIKSDEYVILLDEHGVEVTNQQLATKLENVTNQGHSTLSFIIGGAYGVSPAIKERANFTWSLSPLVFPHQLVRLILAEQLYRTFSLMSGHPYHHK